MLSMLVTVLRLGLHRFVGKGRISSLQDEPRQGIKRECRGLPFQLNTSLLVTQRRRRCVVVVVEKTDFPQNLLVRTGHSGTQHLRNLNPARSSGSECSLPPSPHPLHLRFPIITFCLLCPCHTQSLPILVEETRGSQEKYAALQHSRHRGAQPAIRESFSLAVMFCAFLGCVWLKCICIWRNSWMWLIVWVLRMVSVLTCRFVLPPSSNGPTPLLACDLTYPPEHISSPRRT